MIKENLTDEERAYETYLWEQNLDYSLNLETQASLNKESWLRECEIEEKNLAEYEEDTINLYRRFLDDGIPF